MYAFTDTFVGLGLDWLFNIGTPTRPSAFFVGLHSGWPGASGAINEITGNGYARVSAGTLSRSIRVVSNAGNVDFAAVTGSAWAEVTFASLWSASTAGACYAVAPLTNARGEVAMVDDTTADTFEAPGHGLANGTRLFVQQMPGLAVPTGITKDTVYFVVSASTDDFQLSTTSGGAAVAITGAGGVVFYPITNARTAQVGDVVRFATSALSFELPAAA